MVKLQAKTELERNHIMSLFNHFVSVDEDGMSLLCYVTFDTMAEIVDYLREINNVDTTTKVQWDAMGIGQVTKYERE